MNVLKTSFVRYEFIKKCLLNVMQGLRIYFLSTNLNPNICYLYQKVGGGLIFRPFNVLKMSFARYECLNAVPVFVCMEFRIYCFSVFSCTNKDVWRDLINTLRSLLEMQLFTILDHSQKKQFTVPC